MLHMPSPMLLHSGDRTYSDFQSWIAAQGVTVLGTWDANIGVGLSTDPLSPDKYSTVIGAARTGSMLGSPWSGRNITTSGARRLPRVMQHALPSLAMLDALVGLSVYFETYLGIGNQTGLSRNDFVSSAGSGSGVNGLIVSRVLYWDPALAKVQEMLPFAGSGPNDFNF